ncbi:MAG: hypothetical protein Q7S53_05260 [bacterium]|nr:hypothetical protein [bacterium]
MKETDETVAEESNEELSTLKESLRQALDSGNMQRAGEIKEEMLPHLEAVKDKIMLPPERAKEIMGEDFFGQEALEKTFGTTLEKADIPRIPFTEKELERAKAYDCYLILRTGQLPTGEKLTMRNMGMMLGEKWEKNNFGRVLYDKNRDEDTKADYFLSETPRPGWALFRKSPLIDTKGVNYVQQTGRILEFLKEDLYRGMPPPDDLLQADEEYNAKIWQILRGGTMDIEKATELKANQKYRQTPVEFLYDEAVFMSNKLGDKIYLGKSVLTNRYRVDDSGVRRMVEVSSPSGTGMRIKSDSTGYYNNSDLGASFTIVK